jgi:MFS family permease
LKQVFAKLGLSDRKIPTSLRDRAGGGALGWGGIFLHEQRHATLSLAAAAITACTGGQTLGRLAGDRLTSRWGANTLFRCGAVIAAGGFAAAVLTPPPATAVAGFALAGLGSSVLIPLSFSAVGRLPGAPPGDDGVPADHLHLHRHPARPSSAGAPTRSASPPP